MLLLIKSTKSRFLKIGNGKKFDAKDVAEEAGDGSCCCCFQWWWWNYHRLRVNLRRWWHLHHQTARRRGRHARLYDVLAQAKGQVQEIALPVDGQHRGVHVEELLCGGQQRPNQPLNHLQADEQQRVGKLVKQGTAILPPQIGVLLFKGVGRCR